MIDERSPRHCRPAAASSLRFGSPSRWPLHARRRAHPESSPPRHFDRSVQYLVEEQKYIVCLQHFRGEIEVEEAAFFVRQIDLERGDLVLSDGTTEPLEVDTLELSPIDGALLCRVKRELVEAGLRARFTHSSQADLLHAAEPEGEGFTIEIAGRRRNFPILDALS